MDITTQSTVLFSLCLSINDYEKQLELCKKSKSCTELVQYWEKHLASLKEAKEKILTL